MGAIKVDPPPIAVRVVDSNGYPTRELKEYLYRLWTRTADPKGNLLDEASQQATSAQETANASIELSGNATQQIQQLVAALNQHIELEQAHSSNGAIVGFNDLAETNKAGLVKKAQSVNFPGETNATTSAVVVTAAPATYSQAQVQELVVQLNSRTVELNKLIVSYNQQAAILEQMKQSLIAAGIM